MTIKPVVNQKSAKEETQEGTPQNVHGVGNAGVRTSHRNVVLNQLSSSESQVNIGTSGWFLLPLHYCQTCPTSAMGRWKGG